jgi:mono/diheme cytochrome c family protein
MMIIQTLSKSKYSMILIGLVALILAGACSSGPAATETARLSTPTPIPTFQFVQRTPAPQLATLAAATSIAAASDANSTGLDPEIVARGKDRYEALECASCHGANAEGSDDGSALIESSLNEEDFISFLRSGGTVGSSHQYSTNRLSDGGSRNLYTYIRSLAGD